MKIKRYQNGETCPCCGQVLEGKTREELDRFSVLAAAVGFESDLDPFFPETAEDWIYCTHEDLQRALADWMKEAEG